MFVLIPSIFNSQIKCSMYVISTFESWIILRYLLYFYNSNTKVYMIVKMIIDNIFYDNISYVLMT